MFKNTKKTDQVTEDSFDAYLVENAFFTQHEEYPILKDHMISSNIPKKIMPFDKALNYHGDLSNTFISFYSPDASFKRIYQKPKIYLNFLKRTAGIIGFDFSIHSDMPVSKQKGQIYNNLALTYYYGNNGIPVIPNLRCGIDELLPEFMEAIPKHKIVAVGTHGFCKELQEKCEWYCFIENVINILQPTAIIVYGTLNGKFFDGLKQKSEFFFFEPWISKKRREEKKNGN